MKNSAFSCFLDFDDEIRVAKEKMFSGSDGWWLTLGSINIHGINNKQLLDLGMKIQEVVNQIDKENREIDEKKLMETEL